MAAAGGRRQGGREAGYLRPAPRPGCAGWAAPGLRLRAQALAASVEPRITPLWQRFPCRGPRPPAKDLALELFPEAARGDAEDKVAFGTSPSCGPSADCLWGE